MRKTLGCFSISVRFKLFNYNLNPSGHGHLGLMARRCFPVAKIGSSNLPGVASLNYFLVSHFRLFFGRQEPSPFMANIDFFFLSSEKVNGLEF